VLVPVLAIEPGILKRVPLKRVPGGQVSDLGQGPFPRLLTTGVPVWGYLPPETAYLVLWFSHCLVVCLCDQLCRFCLKTRWLRISFPSCV
jgi:hypothetical protein